MAGKTGETREPARCPLCRFEEASFGHLCSQHGTAAILVFKLPENEEEHRLAVNGGRYHSALWHVDQQCRSWVKHGHSFRGVEEALAAVRQLIADEDVLD